MVFKKVSHDTPPLCGLYYLLILFSHSHKNMHCRLVCSVCQPSNEHTKLVALANLQNKSVVGMK